jgi:hypothetical protein
VAAVIVTICVGAPIVEAFDSWDHTAQDGNETEANIVVVALCVGLTLTIAGAVVARIRSCSSGSETYRAASDRAVLPRLWLAVPIPTSSPPIPLRV